MPNICSKKNLIHTFCICDHWRYRINNPVATLVDRFAEHTALERRINNCIRAQFKSCVWRKKETDQVIMAKTSSDPTAHEEQ